MSRGPAKRRFGSGPKGRVAFYRRSPFLVSYWSGRQFVLENFLTRRRVACDPLALTVLHFFDRYHSHQQLIAALPDYTPASLGKSLRMLVRYSLLQVRGRRVKGEEALRAWSEWNPAAGFFHFSTKDMRFEADAVKEFRGVIERAQSVPMPRPVKRYAGATRVQLPEPAAGGEFAKVVLSRRTWRKFSVKPVALDALGKSLALTFGVQKWVKIPQLGEVAVKTSPSGGALHPIEAYVLARNVENLRPGLYHYDGADHRLQLLRRGASSKQITQWLANQYWYGGAGFVVFLTAVFARTRWKYDYPRAYRAMLLEAGHLCQTFCLTATWLGLGPFCTLAFSDSAIEKAIGIDGVSESVLYVAGAGVRPENEWDAHLLSGSKIGDLKL
jgi:SagB-type dehydrogenase family enzyme